VDQVTRVPATVGRSQNAVFVMPHDWTSIAQFLSPLIERIDEKNRDLQLIVVASDTDVAAAISAAAVKVIDGRDIGIVAATSPRRAARLVRLKPPQIIAAAPDTLVDLLKSAAIKLDTVRTVCIAWADELLVNDAASALETIMTEVPKEAARTVVTSEVNPGVEELLERYARRAPRVASPAVEGEVATSLEYVTVSSATRLSALRRLLDVADPQSAVIFARDENSDTEVRDLLQSLGYSGAEAPVRVGKTAAPGTDLVVLFDLPASREELREAASAAKRSVALIQPRQLTSLRALTAGGSLKSITLPESAGRARTRETRMREELRSVLASGQFGRELLALEPLLDEYDGIEIAAAALQILDRERADRTTTSSTAASSPSARPRENVAMVPLFVNVGSRDGARPADIVGSIASQPGLSSGDIGRVDVRESHTVVEVSALVADSVIERLTGSNIRGRRAIARRDEGRPPRSEGGRDEGRPRPPRREGGRDEGRRDARSRPSGRSDAGKRGAPVRRPRRDD
jgi:ATP-dependent RNA helicase DeaD